MSAMSLNSYPSEMEILKKIRACRVCENHLPHGPRPVIQGAPSSRLLIVGQAPGLKVHESGVPWNDASGERLRAWLGISREVFYDPNVVAILPMGFCYPGRGSSGDAPPRKECFELWHGQFLKQLKKVKLTLLIGNYAQAGYLGKAMKPSATETIRNFRDYLPQYLPLPHPSPRNNIWLKKNPWFEKSVLPELKSVLTKALCAKD